MASELIWSRLEWNAAEGTIAGNSRVMTSADEAIVGTSEFWWGVKDKGAYWEEAFGSSSIYSIIAMYGFVFTIFYLLFFLRYGRLYKKSWAFLLYAFVVIGCMYQRPNIFNLLYLFLFACMARYSEFRITAYNTVNKRHG